MKPRGDLQVALFPAPTDEQGAYLSLLHDALEEAGVRCLSVPSLNRAWARTAHTQVSVVHLHWLEFLAPSDRTPGLGALKTARRAVGLWSTLRELRRRGIAIVWTVHNLAPHEPAHPFIERHLARAMLATADRAIVHSEHARARVAERMGHQEKLVVISHGNYLNVYPQAQKPRALLRRAYALPEDGFVYLSFGQVRRYKQLPELLTAFRALPGERLALLVAGEPRDEREVTRLRALAAQDPRVRLDLRRVPPLEVTAVHRVSDAAVFAYDNMFSSGSLLLALSCGLPVVVPADSTGTEIVVPPAVEPIGADGLTAALRAVRDGDQRTRQKAALAAAASYDWATVGRRTAEVYRNACEESEGPPLVGPRG